MPSSIFKGSNDGEKTFFKYSNKIMDAQRIWKKKYVNYN